MLPRQRSPESIRQEAFNVGIEGQTLKEIEKQALLRALEVNRGNKFATAATLGVVPKTVYTMMRTHGLWPEKEGSREQE